MSPYSVFISHANAMADAAAAVLKGYFRASVPVDWKADNSPVTIADREAEAVCREYVLKNLPSHGIIGEEEGNYNEQAEFVWVFDPIDGTRSFVAGKPLFTTLIALCHKGEPVIGIINQPINNERWVGIKGEKTKFNGVEISSRKCKSVADALLATTSPHYFSEEGLAAFERLRSNCRDVIYGGDAYAYGLLAMGQIDVIMEEGLKFHDVAALKPVLEGTGASIKGWDGSEINAKNYSRVLAVGSKEMLSITSTIL